MDNKRFCPTCTLWKALEYFGRKGTGYARDCLMCKAARERRWREIRIEEKRRQQAQIT